MEDITGKQLNRYQVVGPLGEGGMAAVYKAYHPETERYVALKILPKHFASDPEFIGRFEQEAKLIAQLQHPHILPVFDYGEADGYTYIVMPYVETGTLADLLRGKPLPSKQIQSIVSQVGDALDYAHSRGIVHRDVKPSNILIDERGNCLLMDFGIAKMVEGTKHFTQSGGVVGTPSYMAPEQGLGEKPDGRSDIYSLGVVLYQLATGRLPFESETPMAVAIMHIHDPLPPPRSVNPDLPETIERVILKALTKERQDRYATVAEMVAALGIAIAEPSVPPAMVSESVQPADTESLDPAIPSKSNSRPRWITLAGIGTLGLIVVAVGLGIFYFGSGRFASPIDPEPASTETVEPTPKALASPRLVTPCDDPQHICIRDEAKNTLAVLDVSEAGYVAQFSVISWSPDGQRIVFNACDELCTFESTLHLYTVYADGSNLQQLISNMNTIDPSWSPDGDAIAFVGDGEVYTLDPEGIGRTLLGPAPLSAEFPSWSPDGKWLVFFHRNHKDQSEPKSLWAVRRDGSDLQTLFEDVNITGQALWSPDGALLVFEFSGEGRVQLDTACLELERECDENDLSLFGGGDTKSWMSSYYPQWGGEMEEAEVTETTQEPETAPTPSQIEKVLEFAGNRPPDFKDDFSTEDNNWFTDTSSRLIFSDERMIIENTMPEAGGGTFHKDVAYTDFLIRAEVTLIENPPGGSFGFWFRAPVGPGGCMYEIRPSPSEGPGSYSLSCPGGTMYEAGILSSEIAVNVPNTLELIVIADEMTALFNGKELTTIIDPTWPSGYIGFLAASTGQLGTTIAIETVQVWNLTGESLDQLSGEAEGAESAENEVDYGTAQFAHDALAAVEEREPDVASLVNGIDPFGISGLNQSIKFEDGQLIVPSKAVNQSGNLDANAYIDTLAGRYFVIEYSLDLSDNPATQGVCNLLLDPTSQRTYEFEIGQENWAFMKSDRAISHAPTNLAAGRLPTGLTDDPLLVQYVRFGEDRFAFFVNDDFLAAATDPDPWRPSGSIRIGGWNQITCRYSNFKVWDISDLSK